ncbi:MAG: hypothetical protein IIZ40_02990 [Bacilli bacterium]|nr:hypothetical protein [Bacilli bacterium]
MRKILVLMLVVFTMSACTVVNINTNNYIDNINKVIKRESKYTNKNAVGFQYYLPNGVIQTEVNNFNQRLMSKGDIYYLYADVVSYYHKVEFKYKENKKAYLSKTISYDGKYGYVEVNEDNGKYFVEMMFNYAKIESYVKKENLKDALNNMAFILSSVKYNDDIVKSLLGNEKYKLSESETYNIFKTKKASNDNFLKYVDEYDNYDGENVKDLIEKKEIDQDKDN